jgi:hypothetical protein
VANAGVVIRRLHLELLDRCLRRAKGHTGAGITIRKRVRNAIDLEFVVIGAAAVSRDLRVPVVESGFVRSPMSNHLSGKDGYQRPFIPTGKAPGIGSATTDWLRCCW